MSGISKGSIAAGRSLKTVMSFGCLLPITNTDAQKAEPGARANDHGCHDPCSEQHGSRQPRSWLILNVGRKKAASRILVSDVHRIGRMKAKFTYWKEPDGWYLGYLNSYPDHWTQGKDLEDLKAHLRDLHEMFGEEEIPGIRKVGELKIA